MTLRKTDVAWTAVLAVVPWTRLLLAWAGAFAVGAALALTTMALGWWAGAPWERALLTRVHETLSAGLDAVMLTLPYLGTNYILAPIVLLAAVLLVRRGYPTLAVHLAIVQLGSWTLNPALKFTFMRARPELFEQRGQHAFPAFPSGHMIAVVAVLGTVAYLLDRGGAGKWPYVAWAVFFLLVAYSRLYLGVHWPLDVVGGTAVGAVWLWATLRTFMPLHAAAGTATESAVARDFHQR